MLAAVFVDPPAGPTAAVLIDPQMRYQSRGLLEQGIGVRGERGMHDRP